MESGASIFTNKDLFVALRSGELWELRKEESKEKFWSVLKNFLPLALTNCPQVLKTFFTGMPSVSSQKIPGERKNSSVVRKIAYCKASIKRVIVRFKSLSDRRISSILLMECNTVVWCLPPNCRPISGSDAVVSCFTIYIAT